MSQPELDPAVAVSVLAPAGMIDQAGGRGPSPLRSRDFRLLMGGQTVSAIGTQMQVVAVAWQIYLLTGSKLYLGLIGLARGVPLIAASLVSGVIADAFDRKKTLVVTQSTLAVLSGTLAVLTSARLITPWAIYLLIAGTSMAQAVDQPARSALVPSLVPRAALPRALSLMVALREAATVVGPALGGIVIAAAGVLPNYVIDAVSYSAVLAAVFMLRTRVAHVATGQVNMTALREGWSFIYHNRIILSVQGLDFVANFFGASTVLFPVFAHSIYHAGPQGLGLLYGAASLGAVIGALVFGLFGRTRRQGMTILVSIFVYGAATAAFGLSPWFLVGVGFLVISGAADAISASLRGAVSQLATPDRLRGRVTAVNTMFVAGGPQIGNLEAGVVANEIGAPQAVLLGGLLTMASVVVMFFLSGTVRSYSWGTALHAGAVGRVEGGMSQDPTREDG